jgi:hypothetical protein
MPWPSDAPPLPTERARPAHGQRPGQTVLGLGLGVPNLRESRKEIADATATGTGHTGHIGAAPLGATSRPFRPRIYGLRDMRPATASHAETPASENMWDSVPKAALAITPAPCPIVKARLFCAQCGDPRTTGEPCQQCSLANEPIPMDRSTRDRIRRHWRASLARQEHWQAEAALRVAAIGQEAADLELQREVDILFKGG